MSITKNALNIATGGGDTSIRESEKIVRPKDAKGVILYIEIDAVAPASIEIWIRPVNPATLNLLAQAPKMVGWGPGLTTVKGALVLMPGYSVGYNVGNGAPCPDVFQVFAQDTDGTVVGTIRVDYNFVK
jgi:hypothetical protein